MLQTIGIVLCALGLIGLIYGIMQKLKAGRVADAPLVKTGDAAARGAQVAGPRGAISVEGNVLCQQPIMAPVSGVPCLYYELKCTAEWKDGDTTKTKEITHDKMAAQWAVDDGSGPVWVDCKGGGDFEPTQTKQETKGGGLIGGITGQDIVFGNYRVSPGMFSGGTKYTVREDVLPVQQRMYVCGKAADGGGAVTSPSWRNMIMSSKSRDDLLSSATKGAKMFMAGGAGGLAAGVALAVIGQLTSTPDAPTAGATPTDTTATAAGDGTPAGDTPAATTKPGQRPVVGKPGAKPAATGAATGAPAAAATATPAAATGAATAKPAATAAAATGKPATPPATAAPAKPPAPAKTK